MKKKFQKMNLVRVQLTFEALYFGPLKTIDIQKSLYQTYIFFNILPVISHFINKSSYIYIPIFKKN